MVRGDTANRPAKVAAAIITAVLIVGGAEFVAHYYFFCGVELVCLSPTVRYVRQRPAADDITTPTGSQEVHVGV